MRTSIILVTYNRLVFTRICLTALLTDTLRSSDIEIVVVDNGSSDGTQDFLRSLPSPCRVVLNRHNRNFAGGCNQGADLAKGENLVFLNNDTVPLAGWLDPLVDILDRPEVGIVGGKLLFPDETIQHAGVVITDSLIPAHLYYLFPGNHPPANVEREYQAVTGACLAIRRSLFHSLGGFDEGYQNSFEDIDLCLRVRSSGKSVVYTPKSVIFHFESVSEGRHDRDDTNQVRYLNRWQDVVIADESEWYRRDGFSTVPRLPARTVSQARSLTQLERRRADALERIVVSFSKLDASKPAQQFPARGISIAPQMFAVIPTAFPSGDEASIDARIVEPRLAHDHSAVLSYAWQRQGALTVMWSGEAARLPQDRGGVSYVSATVLVPSIVGEYSLVWTFETGGTKHVVARQDVVVATKFAHEISASLPDAFIAGESQRVIVRIRNTGTEPWFPHGGFRLSYHWFEETGRYAVVWEGSRTPILERLGFGEETVVEAVVLSPPTPGRYLFAWDAVHEGKMWFSDEGSEMGRVLVEVRPVPYSTTVEHATANGHPNFDSGNGSASVGPSVRELAAGLRSRDAALRLAKKEAYLYQQKAAALEMMLPEAELLRQQQLRTIAGLEERLQKSEGRVEQLSELVQAIQRGRMLRILNALGRLRQRLF